MIQVIHYEDICVQIYYIVVLCEAVDRQLGVYCPEALRVAPFSLALRPLRQTLQRVTDKQVRSRLYDLMSWRV